jgi:hypothetical protein
MNGSDLFVGGVAILLGVGGLVAAIAGNDFFFRWKKLQWVDERAGRTIARLVYAIAGIALILIGIAIVQGYRPNR